jgi:hypothetical protein
MTVLGGVLTGSAGPVAGKPYTNAAASIDCTSCHNVHFEGAWAANSGRRPFLRSVSGSVSGFCAECHGDRLNTSVGSGNATGNHPVNIAYTDSALNGSGAIVLKALAAGGPVSGTVGSLGWSLGGKFEGNLAGAPTAANNIGCHTCHAVHNPASGTDQANHLLAVNNATTTSALCETCHGDATTPNAPRANSLATYKIGVTAGDHPIDAHIATPGPTIDRWYATAGSTVRAERNAANGNAVGGDWPRGSVTIDYGAGPVTAPAIICTSCHSAHRATLVVAGAGGKLKRTGTLNTFCTACHADASPSGHHTHSANTGASVGETFVSGIDCTDCHGGAGATFAHNGFNFNTFAAGNDASQLCVGCHGGGVAIAPAVNDDPLPNAGTFGGTANTLPADHLGFTAPNAARKSHWIGGFANAVNAINVKTGKWLNGWSKYGGSGVDNHNASVPTVNASSTIVCESCHSVLHNAGAGATATPTSGWKANLLLQNYVDDTVAVTGNVVQSEMCVACHNNNINANGLGTSNGTAAWSTVNASATVPPGTHPMTGWTVTRAVDAGRVPTTLITGAGTYADAAGAPNGAQYYGANAMDCDSCHRPHYAPANSTFNQTKAAGANVARPVILEVQAAVNEWADLCQQCHNM